MGDNAPAAPPHIPAPRERSPLSRAIDVSAVANPQNDDFVIAFVYSIEDPVRPASGAPDVFQFTPQRSADSLRVCNEGAGDEVDDSKGDRFGECLADGSSRWRRDHQLVIGIVHRVRRAFTAWTPRTTSPSK